MSKYDTWISHVDVLFFNMYVYMDKEYTWI